MVVNRGPAPKPHLRLPHSGGSGLVQRRVFFPLQGTPSSRRRAHLRPTTPGRTVGRALCHCLARRTRVRACPQRRQVVYRQTRCASASDAFASFELGFVSTHRSHGGTDVDVGRRMRCSWRLAVDLAAARMRAILNGFAWLEAVPWPTSRNWHGSTACA